MALGDIIRKKIPTSGDGKKIRELTGADTFGDFMQMAMGKKPISATTSTPVTQSARTSTPVTQKMVSAPTIVDVTAPKKKYASIGTSQMRSGRRSTIQTSPTGLMSKATIGKKTLLGE